MISAIALNSTTSITKTNTHAPTLFVYNGSDKQLKLSFSGSGERFIEELGLGQWKVIKVPYGSSLIIRQQTNNVWVARLEFIQIGYRTDCSPFFSVEHTGAVDLSNYGINDHSTYGLILNRFF